MESRYTEIARRLNALGDALKRCAVRLEDIDAAARAGVLSEAVTLDEYKRLADRHSACHASFLAAVVAEAELCLYLRGREGVEPLDLKELANDIRKELSKEREGLRARMVTDADEAREG